MAAVRRNTISDLEVIVHRLAKNILPVVGFALILSFISALPVKASDNGLAKTPPMGWNSWNKFHCHVSDDMIRGMADAMVSSGMKDAGYEYIVIDDCWQVSRDAAGNIVPDPQGFPNGIKALADYVHSKGLKFGIYSDAGTQTCAGRPGSAGHEFQDAIQYAAWGVDYLKFDWCHTGKDSGKANAEWAYATMRDALKSSGRPILFSICEWGSNKPWLWAADIGNMWRTTGDISDCWDCDKHGLSFVKIIDAEDGLETYAGPGHWNDPDMLEVGNGKMTNVEYRAHFSLWALLAAPLIAGNDLRDMSAETKEILMNKEVLAVDQDAAGIQGHRVKKDADLEVWSKQLQDGGRAVVLFNRRASESSISFAWEDIGYPAHLNANVRDLWAHKDLGKHDGKFVAVVPSHGVVMVKVMPL